MNTTTKHLSFLLIAPIIFISNISAVTAVTPDTQPKTDVQTPPPSLGKRFHFNFNFTNKPLIDLINELATEKNINIILPQAGNGIPAATTITYHMPEPISIDEAWIQLIALLELAGYTVSRDGNITFINKIDTNIARQPLHIYIDEPLENIPDTEQVIKAIFYLQNLSIKQGSQTNTELTKILTDMLSKTAADPATSGAGQVVVGAGIILDDKTNALILTDKANNIKSVMKLIQELDKSGMRDSIEIIPLYYIAAKIVEDLFTKQLLAQKTEEGQSAAQPLSYFPKNTKVMALERTNSLIIMGTPYAIDAAKDFVVKYIDKPLESGESILHVYTVQNLDAEKLAKTLTDMIGTTASQATGQQAGTGSKQYFKDVIIVAETKNIEEGNAHKAEQLNITQTAPEKTAPPTPSTSGTVQVGGNRLIIAARKQDWIRIEKLIQQLDKPPKQVALEVLIVDITLDSDKMLGSQTRNRKGFNESVSKNINFQTAHLSSPILKKDTITDINGNQALRADALMANLLQLGGQFGDGQNLASTAPPASFIISLNDINANGIWSVFQIMNTYSNATILAQPFIITKNHVQGSVTISEKRFLPGPATSNNVSPVTTKEYVHADLIVDMLPNISSSGNINLQIVVNLSEFEGENTNSRITRLVQTNANIGNNQILALGGLTRTTENIGVTKTPILGDIPLLGWFFKRQEKTKTKNNLVILICPTIIEPKVLGGVDGYTQRKLNFTQNNLDESLLFENLRDPITRWFFQPDPCHGKNVVEGYVQETAAHLNNNDVIFAKGSKNNTQTSLTPSSVPSEKEHLKQMVQNEGNPLSSQEVPGQVDLL